LARRSWLLFVLVIALPAGRDGAWGQPASPAAPDVKVETRAIPDRDVKQVRAQAIIAAPSHVVRAVIVDLERYPAFMPYVKESRVLPAEPAGETRRAASPTRSPGGSRRDCRLASTPTPRSGSR